jgi:hypothetical protein
VYRTRKSENGFLNSPEVRSRLRRASSLVAIGATRHPSHLQLHSGV